VRFQVLTAASMMFRIEIIILHGSSSQKTILNIMINNSSLLWYPKFQYGDISGSHRGEYEDVSF
jgi:hypothetical protein